MASQFASMAAALTDALKLAQPPIALCLTDAVPPGVRSWQGRVPAGCQFWQEAARGVFATSPRDHDLCAIGTFTHNLEVTEAHEADRRDALGVFADLGYVRAQDIPLIPILRARPRHVVYGPLAAIPLPPDVVLLFVKAGQMLILSEASQQLEGGPPPAMGRPACAVVPQATNTGRAALSLGCCGARAYLDVLTNDRAPDLHGRQHLGDRGSGRAGALHLDGNQARVSVARGERDGFQVAVDGRFPPRGRQRVMSGIGNCLR